MTWGGARMKVRLRHAAGEQAPGEVVVAVGDVAQAGAGEAGDVVIGVVKQLREHADELFGQLDGRYYLSERRDDAPAAAGPLSQQFPGELGRLRVPASGYGGDHGGVVSGLPGGGFEVGGLSAWRGRCCPRAEHPGQDGCGEVVVGPACAQQDVAELVAGK
jgi:hypothetical protein